MIKQYAKQKGTSFREAEQAIIAIITKVARSVAPTYRFGYHTIEDMEQQAVVFALDVLTQPDVYDTSRPLENFLSVHIRNRLSNFRRQHYMRTEPPCKCCDPYIACSGSRCQKWIDWNKRNTIKQSLMKTVDTSTVFEKETAKDKDISHGDELAELVDRLIPMDLRRDYLKMIDGESVPKHRREKVQGAVTLIMEAYHQHAPQTEV